MQDPQPTSGNPSDARKPVDPPLVVYGSSALGNLYEALPDEQKLSIVEAWLRSPQQPILVDTAGKYGAGLAMECLGDCLRRLGVSPEAVRIGVKLGWRRVPLVGDEPTFEPGAWVGLSHDAVQQIDREGIRACWDQSLELLGEPYAPELISVHDPDEYLAAACDEADRDRRWGDVLEAYDELAAIAAESSGVTVGVGSKDFQTAARIAEATPLDWVMLANCVTAYTHDPEALAFIASCAEGGVAVINSGVFNAGFLVGGKYFDYRLPCPEADATLFRWRDRFFELCEDHAVAPSHACVQFGLSPPGVVSVALNTTNASRVAKNLELASTQVPEAFWREAKQRSIIDPHYPYLAAD